MNLCKFAHQLNIEEKIFFFSVTNMCKFAHQELKKKKNTSLHLWLPCPINLLDLDLYVYLDFD